MVRQVSMAVQTYRGTVADQSDTVVLEKGASLPPGTEVLVTPVTAAQPRRGSPQALAEAFRESHADPEDVRELMRLIEESRLPADWSGVFDGATEE